MPAAVVQSQINALAASVAPSVQYNSAVTAGSALVIAITIASSTVTITNVLDGADGFWFQASLEQAQGRTTAIYYYISAAGGALPPTVQFNLSVSIPSVVALYEVSGVASLGNTATNNGAATTTPHPGSISASTGDFVLGCVRSAGTVSSVTSGWTLLDNNGAGSAYEIPSSSGTQNPAFTTTSGVFCGCIAQFVQTNFNATWSSGAKATLTATEQVLLRPAFSSGPKTSISLQDQILKRITLSISPTSSLNLSDQVLKRITISIGPKSTFSLTGQTGVIHINAIWNSGPKIGLTLGDQKLACVNWACNPRAILVLNPFYKVPPSPGGVPYTPIPVNGGGTFYLRILLQALYTWGNRTVRDINGNYYPISNVLYSGNDSLLNSIVYYNPDSKRITPCTNLQNLTGQAPNLVQINLWVDANSPGGPMVIPPPPIFGLVETYLYDVSSPV